MTARSYALASVDCSHKSVKKKTTTTTKKRKEKKTFVDRLSSAGFSKEKRARSVDFSAGWVGGGGGGGGDEHGARARDDGIPK